MLRYTTKLIQFIAGDVAASSGFYVLIGLYHRLLFNN